MRAETLPSPSDSPAGMAVVLINPVASPAAVRLTRSLQHGVELAASHWLLGPEVTHRGQERLRVVGSEKGRTGSGRHRRTDRRHAVRRKRVLDLLNSKSMLVVPLGSCTLCQNTLRNLPFAFDSR